jgi:hypothetical protein
MVEHVGIPRHTENNCRTKAREESRSSSHAFGTCCKAGGKNVDPLTHNGFHRKVREVSSMAHGAFTKYFLFRLLPQFSFLLYMVLTLIFGGGGEGGFAQLIVRHCPP